MLIILNPPHFTQVTKLSQFCFWATWIRVAPIQQSPDSTLLPAKPKMRRGGAWVELSQAESNLTAETCPSVWKLPSLLCSHRKRYGLSSILGFKFVFSWVATTSLFTPNNKDSKMFISQKLSSSGRHQRCLCLCSFCYPLVSFFPPSLSVREVQYISSLCLVFLFLQRLQALPRAVSYRACQNNPKYRP